MKKRVFALALAMVLVLAGCGSNGGDSQSPAPGGSQSGAAPEKTTFVVGMECNYAPFNWTQVEAGETAVSLGGAGYADGYDVVMAQTIAKALGLTLEIKKIEWTGLEPALSSGEIDAIIAGMTDIPERREGADFTKPYYESEMVCIVRAGDPLAAAASLEDFTGKKVLGQLNTTYDEVIDQIPEVQHLTPMQSYPLMVVALQQKEADALTAELPVAEGMVASNPDLAIVRFAEGKGFQADTTVSVAVRKGNTDLLEKVQGVLDTIDADTRNQWMRDAVERQPAND